ncbi:MAG: ECF transporter S component [Chloroflexi bacterium]|nr:ECF transporter S component [Chloroflexota bacterium]
MDKKLLSVLGALAVLLAIFAIVMFGLGTTEKLGPFNFSVDQATLPLRFAFVVIGVAVAFAVYFFTKENKIWEVGTREVVYMAIGAALYAIFSYLFNGTVFVVPSLSQVSLRPAIAIPMFFGYAFGPVVGFFTGAVGNMFGDALTGFGLSPQWSIGNGLVGFVAGLVYLFKDKKKSMDMVLYISGGLTVLAAVLYFLNPSQSNMTFFDPANNVFGDAQISLFAGISILVGFVLVAAVRFGFAKNVDVAAAVTWGMLGNILGIGFAAISDIWINGFSVPAAVVGEFLPAAGPNLIFAAILVPLLVAAYAAVQRQSGR